MWKKHAKGNVVGVSDDEPGETYWKVANGIRLTGMPAYKHVMTDTQMWQVTLLLKNADQELPDPVMKILTATIERGCGKVLSFRLNSLTAKAAFMQLALRRV